MKLKIILLLFPIICFSQLSAKVDSLYQQLNSQKGIDGRNIGYDGHESEVYQIYAELDSVATDDEALYMAQNGNGVVKGYMSNVLVDRKSKHLAKLFSDYIKNDAEVYIHSGCTGYASSIAGELYGSIFYQNKKIEGIIFFMNEYTIEEMKKYQLDYETRWTKPEVDSLLLVLNKIALTNDNALPITLRHIFALNDFRFENHEKIKYFANKYPEIEILATLASFQNKKDLPLLHNNIDKAFIAISRFPDKSFIPELKTRIDEGINDYYFMDAATAFCNKEADELLNRIVEKFEAKKDAKGELFLSDGEIYSHFYNCLEKMNCNYNDSFLIKLWTNKKMISYSFFHKIKDTHYNEILEGYLKPFKIDSQQISDDFDFEKHRTDFDATDGYLCPIILKYLKENSSRSNDKSINLDTVECKG